MLVEATTPGASVIKLFVVCHLWWNLYLTVNSCIRLGLVRLDKDIDASFSQNVGNEEKSLITLTLCVSVIKLFVSFME